MRGATEDTISLLYAQILALDLFHDTGGHGGFWSAHEHHVNVSLAFACLSEVVGGGPVVALFDPGNEDPTGEAVVELG